MDSNFSHHPGLPTSFCASMQSLLGTEATDFLQAILQEPVVSIRCNDKKSINTHELSPVPWCPDAYYLSERPVFTLDPFFHAGAYYVQEASSMFLYQALSQTVSTDACVLDLCAAPGGKSTLALHYLKNGFLVANEVIRSRAYILAENLQKWGAPNVAVTNNYPADWGKFTAQFDAILVDAPCSGEGMFRKDGGAITEWSEENVRMCAQRQREIITDVWNALKQGGVMIYSTCTYNTAENEENVRWIQEELGAEYIPINISPEWNITTWGAGYRFLPHKTKGEGLFMAVLRKTDGAVSPKKLKTKSVQKNSLPFPDEVRRWVTSEATPLALPDNIWCMTDGTHLSLMQQIVEHLRPMYIGVQVAQQKGKSLIPQPSLALSKVLNKHYFQSIELSKEEILNYLRGEALSLQDVRPGHILMTYEGLPLGWMKHIGNRANNLYPNEWRIRHL